ncbi:hypothetical protein MHTCC0001_31410 [Flavobacteriaceae bacterium MHTCC 0001]
MKTIYFNILVLILSHYGFAQTIEKFSVDSGGASSKVSNIQILYTIGEVNIAERSALSASLSEGFINGEQNATLSMNAIVSNERLSIYPNPASNILHIKTIENIISTAFYDVLGKRVLRIFNSTDISINHLKSLLSDKTF